MKGVIIGAGRGRRLGGMTELIPKTLVEVVGRPMLEHVLRGALPRAQLRAQRATGRTTTSCSRCSAPASI